MKAPKGCTNKECNAYIKKIKFKEEYDYCPFCGSKLQYVCADCWKVLEHNDEAYCEKCRTIRQKKKVDMIKKVDEHKKLIVGAVDVAWKHKEKIIDSGKKIAKVVVKMK